MSDAWSGRDAGIFVHDGATGDLRAQGSPVTWRGSNVRHHMLLISPHASYLQLGATAESRQQAYRSLFQQSLELGVLGSIREVTHHGWALGGERFRAEIERLSRHRARRLPKGRPCKKQE